MNLGPESKRSEASTRTLRSVLIVFWLVMAGFALALFLGSCSNTDSYRSDFAEWSSDFKATVHRYMPNGVTAYFSRVEEARDFAKALDDLAGRLKKMKPLPIVQSEHLELIDDVRAGAASLRLFADDDDGGDDWSGNITGVLGGRIGSLDVLSLVADIEQKLRG